MIPKTPADAAAPSDTFDASAITAGAALGWYFEEPQLQPKYGERAVVLAAMKSGKKRSVAVIAEKVEECSSAGGTHVLLKAGGELIQFGGHGAMLHVGLEKGELYVVAYDPISPPQNIENSAFCVPSHLIHGRATALLQVKDQAEGEHLLEQLAR